MPTRLWSLGDPAQVRHAVNVISRGGFVAIQYHGTFILIFSGTDPDARRRALSVKGEVDSGRPLSSLSSSGYVWPYLDRGSVRIPELRALLDGHRRYRDAVGAICHVRLPLRGDAVGDVVPSGMVSVEDGIPSIQCLEPSGNVLFGELIDLLAQAGVPLVTGSSLNRHGEPEIVELVAAQRFCREVGIADLYRDPLFKAPDVRGSFPIIDFVSGSAMRDGHVPIQLIDAIVGHEFDKTGMRPARFGQSPVLLQLRDEGLTGSSLRDRVLAYLALGSTP